MLSLLVFVLVALIVCAIAYYAAGALGLPQNVAIPFCLLVLLVALIYALDGSHAHW